LENGISSHADSVHKADSTLGADSAKNVQAPPRTKADTTQAGTPEKKNPLDALKHILGK